MTMSDQTFEESLKQPTRQRYVLEDSFKLNIGKLDKTYLRQCFRSGEKCQELSTIIIPGRGTAFIIVFYRFVITDNKISVALRYRHGDTGAFMYQTVDLTPVQNRVLARWYFSLGGQRLSVLYLKQGGRRWGSRTDLDLVYNLQTLSNNRFGKLAERLHWTMKIQDLLVDTRRKKYRGKPTRNLLRFEELCKSHIPKP